MIGSRHLDICFVLVWSCKKKKVVSLSNIEAKYHGVINVAIEVVWIQQLLVELSFSVDLVTVIFCDNQSVI